MTAAALAPLHGRRRTLIGITLACLAAATAGLLRPGAEPTAASAPAPVASAQTLARGAYLARLGNCAGCHTARGGAPYAGGRDLPTPFGTVYASNLTPDSATGIGAWSADDFWHALHEGRSRDGRLLAPAFPYDRFTLVTRADSDALYVYLRSLAPVRQATPPTGLRFPYGTRAALTVWRALYFRPAAAEPAADPGRSASWRRGAYLVRGLGHCAACHAPRNAMGATVEPDAMTGAMLPMQAWFAPALGPDGGAIAPQRQRLIELLRSGRSDHGTVTGPMAEVVYASTQYWSDADLASTADYLLSLPAVPAPAGAIQPAMPAQRSHGERVYADVCASCHGDQGQGAPGAYPPLAGNLTVTAADPGNALLVVRNGGFAPATATNPRPYGMPPSFLSEQDLADVLSYVRQSWGNQASAVTVPEVLREAPSE